MVKHDKNKCRVCGLDNYPDFPWGENGLEPSNIICACCGVEFGYEDAGGSVSHLAKVRRHWVEVKNCSWFLPKERPVQWDMPQQLRGIPVEFASPEDEELISIYSARAKMQ
jgi:hypothetical protein